MCISAALAIAAVSVAASAGGAFASIQSANAEKANARYQQKVEYKQLAEQRQSAQLQALRQEVGRVNEFAATRSAALASLGASGLGESMSFAQGIDPAAVRYLGQDIQSVRLNLLQQESTISDKVRVSEFGSRLTAFNSGMSKIGAVAKFAQDAMSAASFYGKTS
jgi:hypothetical protein